MIYYDKISRCAAEIAQCTEVEEVIDILKRYDLSDIESMYCCIVASCANSEEINLLEKQISAAESALSM